MGGTDHPDSPEGLLADARRANAAGRSDEADALIRAAIALLEGDSGVEAPPDPERAITRAQALVTLSVPVYERSGLTAALGLLSAAVASSPPDRRESLNQLATIQQAGLRARSGEWQSAVDLLEGVTLDGDLVGPRELGMALITRGLAHQYLGDHGRSAADLGWAEELGGGHGHPEVARIARHNRGCLALLGGDVPRAIALMLDARTLDRGPTAPEFLLDLGRAHFEGGLLEEATELLHEALAAAEGAGGAQVRGEISIELARVALVRGAADQALTRAESAGAEFARHESPRWQSDAAIIVVQAGLLTSSEVDLTSLDVALASGSPGLVHRAALTLAEAALARGEFDSARALLVQARAHRSSALSSQLHQDFVAASLGAMVGDRRGTVRTLRSASRRVVDATRRSATIDNRTGLALHGRRLAALDLRQALATGRPTAVHAASERWRALSARFPGIQSPADEALREWTARLRVLEATRADGSDRDAAARMAAISALRQRISRRSRHLASIAPGPVDARGGDPIPLRDLHPALQAAETGAVSLFVVDGEVHALVQPGDGGNRLVSISPEGAVRAACQAIRADLTAVHTAPSELHPQVRASLERDLARLDALLFRGMPWAAPRVVVVPSSVTPSIPWRMLPSLRERPVVVASSLTAWARGAHRSTGLGGPPLVSALVGPRVDQAQAECEAVATAWSRRTRSTADDADRDDGDVGAPSGTRPVLAAQSTDLVAALTGSDVVHVAAHGQHHAQSPLFSSIQMHDGPVFAHEFQRLPMRAAHVVLSSCDVGRAHLRTGDEALGLAASLLDTGVAAVVASVAPVRHEVAVAVMSAYHRELAAGTDSALALLRASTGIPDAGLFATYGANWCVDEKQ